MKKLVFRNIFVAHSPAPGRNPVFWSPSISVLALCLTYSKFSINTCWVSEWVHQLKSIADCVGYAQKRYDCILGVIFSHEYLFKQTYIDRTSELGVKTAFCEKTMEKVLEN